MQKHKNASLKLLTILFLSIGLWFITSTNGMKLNILRFAVISILSAIFIFKNKNISKNDIFTGALLGIMTMTYSIMTGLGTCIAYIGGVSMLKRGNNKITLLKSNERKEVLQTIILAAIVGIALGGINVYLGHFSNSIDPSFKLKWILIALYSGISEEIIFRFFFFAICVWVTGNKELSRFESFLCYLIMIIPHVLNHFDRKNINLSAVVQLSLMFGVPFSLMQRKRDLSSAIGAHGIVNLIRFTTFGA